MTTPSDLPRAKSLGKGQELRQLLAAACSEAQVDASRRAGDSAAAQQLVTLLTAAIAQVSGVADDVLPTVSSKTQAFGVASIVLTYSKPLDPDWVPAIADFAITDPARTVTGVSVVGSTVLVAYSGDVLVTADAPLIAYTQSTQGMRDIAGNLAASFTAAAVTVAGA